MQKCVIAFSVGLILMLCLCASAPAFAQQWDASQKEVWAAVEKAWETYAKDDLEGALSYYHPDYMGWHYMAPLPAGKDITEKWITYLLPKKEVVLYTLQPVAIQVHGNFAVVHYYFTMVAKTEKDEEKISSGRWTETWAKQDNKWLIIGDHGGTTSGDK